MATYVDSKGRAHEVSEMHYPYLKNALAKLKREENPFNDVLIADMERELRDREAAYAAEQAAIAANGGAA